MTGLEATIHQLHGSGLPLKQISQQLRKEHWRVKASYRIALGKVAWAQAQQKAQLQGLSVRTTTRLITAGLTTRGQIVSALTQNQNGQCSRISGLGVKGYREVCSWAGMTPPQQNQRRRLLYL